MPLVVKSSTAKFDTLTLELCSPLKNPLTVIVSSSAPDKGENPLITGLFQTGTFSSRLLVPAKFLTCMLIPVDSISGGNLKNDSVV